MSSQSCWRFDIDPAQQEALGTVAETVGNRAVVCYAAPAFHRWTELNAHTVMALRQKGFRPTADDCFATGIGFVPSLSKW
jgi:hypothetical protein